MIDGFPFMLEHILRIKETQKMTFPIVILLFILKIRRNLKHNINIQKKPLKIQLKNNCLIRFLIHNFFNVPFPETRTMED
jgi:hypothetical protein